MKITFEQLDYSVALLVEGEACVRAKFLTQEDAIAYAEGLQARVVNRGQLPNELQEIGFLVLHKRTVVWERTVKAVDLQLRGQDLRQSRAFTGLSVLCPSSPPTFDCRFSALDLS